VGTNFDLAPPPKTTAGRTAVPIDISTIEALLRFDGATRTASADATLRFEVGTTAGYPIFDLRQTITGAWLDGTAYPVEKILTADLGGGPGAQLRMLDTVLPSHSRHALRLTYVLGAPQSPAGGSYPPAIEWAEGPRLRFNFGFTDLAAARYLEAWIPANLIWDQYAMVLDVEVTGTPVVHRPIINGELAVRGINQWTVTFPARFTALSPLLEVRAEDTLASASRAVVLPGSEGPVTVEVVKRRSDPVDLAATLTDLSSWLQDNAEAIGPYIHGDCLTAFMIQGGMEYEGACTAAPESLRHEVFHSWWGRGIKPASQADGWWDEGWNVYHDNGATGTRAFDIAEPPRGALHPQSVFPRDADDGLHRRRTVLRRRCRPAHPGRAGVHHERVLPCSSRPPDDNGGAGSPPGFPRRGSRAGGRVSPLGVRIRRSGPRAGVVLPRPARWSRTADLGSTPRRRKIRTSGAANRRRQLAVRPGR
jgi:hypothetical protein